MGSRGPKPGFKAARAAAQAAGEPLAKPATKAVARKVAPAVAAVPKQPDQPPQAQAEVVEVLSAADRENPAKLSGQALKDLGHRRGLSRSEMERMDDDKIRMQLRYVTARMSEEELVG